MCAHLDREHRAGARIGCQLFGFQALCQAGDVKRAHIQVAEAGMVGRKFGTTMKLPSFNRIWLMGSRISQSTSLTPV